MSKLQKYLLPLGLIALVIAGCYFHTFSYPFLYDDQHTVTNAYLDDDGLKWGQIWDEYGSRFVPMVSLALQAKLDAANPTPYHLVNMLIHLSVCFVIYLLLRRVLGDRHIYLALFLALVFAAHPLNTQAVTYISQRLASIVTLFYILSVLFYFDFAKSRAPKYLTLATVFALLAGLSKQNAVTIVGAWLLAELCFGKENRESWKSLVPVGISALCITAFIFFLEFKRTSATRADIYTDVTQPTQPDFLLTQPLVLLEYLRLFFWPVGQSLERDILPVTDFLSARFLVPLAMHLVIIGGAVFALWRKRMAIGFGVLAFYLALLPESSIFPLEYYAEHRTYLPMFGLLIACGGLIQLSGDWARAKGVRIASIAAGALIIVALGVTAYERNKVWESRVALWTDVMNKAPKRFRSYHNLGMIAIDEGRYEDALELYKKATEVAPQVGSLWLNMGHAASKLGNHQLAAEIGEKLIEVEPTPLNHAVVAWAYFYAGDLETAKKRVKRCLELFPQFPQCVMLVMRMRQ